MSTYLQIINWLLFNCRTELVIYLVNSFSRLFEARYFARRETQKWCVYVNAIYDVSYKLCAWCHCYYIFSLYILYRQKLFAFERFITYLHSVLSFTCYVLIAQSGGTSLATHFTMLFHCYKLLAYYLVALLKNWKYYKYR